MIRKIEIKGREFQVVGLVGEAFKRWTTVVEQLAKDHDKPLERFIKKLGGVSDEDRKIAIAAFVTTPGWDTPPKYLCQWWAASPPGAAYLLRAACKPTLSEEEANELIGEDYHAIYCQIAKAINDPVTPAELNQQNEELKARLRGAKECQQTTS